MFTQSSFYQHFEYLRHPAGWCVSILLRTERGFQDHKKTAAKLKDTEQQAVEGLQENFGAQAVKRFQELFHSGTENLSFAHSKDGIGIYVDDRGARVVHFPFAVSPRVVVDQSFEIRDILYGISLSSPYYVLVLSKDDSRLYNGINDVLVQVSDKGDLSEEDRIYTDPHGVWKFSKGRNDNDRWHDHLNHIDQLLGHYLNRRLQPFFILGMEADTNYFANHTRHGQWMAGKASGAFDHAGPDQIMTAVGPLMEGLTRRRLEETMDIVRSQASSSTLAQGIRDIWPLASVGRVQTLIITRSYSVAAYTTTEGQALYYQEEPQATVYHADAVDDLAEMVLEMNGEVVFSMDDALAPYGHVVALLRY